MQEEPQALSATPTLTTVAVRLLPSDPLTSSRVALQLSLPPQKRAAAQAAVPATPPRYR